jgi:hypothetical protein
MTYYRSIASTISQGFQKILICYFTNFLWFTMHFQKSAKTTTNQSLERVAELEVVAARLRGAWGGRMLVAMELPRASMATVVARAESERMRGGKEDRASERAGGTSERSGSPNRRARRRGGHARERRPCGNRPLHVVSHGCCYCRLKNSISPQTYNWNTPFVSLYLIIRFELAKTSLIEVVELHEVSNFY